MDEGVEHPEIHLWHWGWEEYQFGHYCLHHTIERELQQIQAPYVALMHMDIHGNETVYSIVRQADKLRLLSLVGYDLETWNGREVFMAGKAQREPRIARGFCVVGTDSPEVT
jgi:hypothetical protein